MKRSGEKSSTKPAAHLTFFTALCHFRVQGIVCVCSEHTTIECGASESSNITGACATDPR